MVECTVVICTHRPRSDHISRTMKALRAQTFGPGGWELWVIGDESTLTQVGKLDLSWQPQLRLIKEEGKGISRARMQGLREFVSGSTSLLLFVDDDNVLAPDYLELGVQIARSEERLACWGGQMVGEFESAPPDWIGPFLKYIAVFPLEKEFRSSVYQGNYDAVPPTAGMFLRRVLAERFLQSVAAAPHRLALGGTREAPICGEDMDIALTAFDLGLELARLPQLKLTHLISSDRLTAEYIGRLLTSIRAGTIVLESLRGPSPKSRSAFALGIDRLRALRLPEPHRRFFLAELRGEAQAGKILRKLGPK